MVIMVDGKLLITDDDRDFRESLAEGLNRRGFEILLAADGQEAIEIIRNQTIRLLMLDIHMPRLGGLETLAEVRRFGMQLPCILMSAKLDEMILSRARSLRSDWVLAKPFSLNTIASAIQSVMECRDWTDPKHDGA
jgi:DNA-binding response OmpR family regulator